MNWPNKLTILRILLVPIIILFLLVESIPNRFLFAIIVFAIASITDHIDGHIARKYNMITNFGKFADPLADKILVISVLLCFVQLRVITALPVIIIIAREFLVTSIRLIASQNGKVISANMWGKLKTVSQMISIFVLMLVSHFGQKDLLYLCGVSLWISALLTTVSGIVYLKQNLDVLKTAV